MDYKINKKASLLLEYAKKTPEGNFVEIGCIRSEIYDPDDGYSTYFLAKFCKENGINFYSFDTDENSVNIANKILSKNNLKQSVYRKDGKKALEEINNISFLFLDSHKNPLFSVEQFISANLLPNAILIVDDCQRIEHWEFGKATYIKQLFDKNNIEYKVIDTQPGWKSFVSIIKNGKNKNEIL